MSSLFISFLSPTVTDEKSLELVVHADADSDCVIVLEFESERLIFGFEIAFFLASEFVWFSFFFKCVCHTFFISLSVLPGSFAAIADHLEIRIELVICLGLLTRIILMIILQSSQREFKLCHLRLQCTSVTHREESN